MKLAFLAGVALIAAPALAQTQTTTTTTQSTDTQTQPAPAPTIPGGVPNTPLSTSPTPSDGPRAQQGDMPANSAATGANAAANAATTTTTTVAPTPDGGAVVTTGTSADPAAPAPMDHYPICKAGQFTGCMEPGNHGGHATTTHRKRR